MRKKIGHWLEASVKQIFSQNFQYQVLFCVVAFFFLFIFVFFVNALNLKYRLLPGVSEGLIHLVFVSPVVDKFLFYVSSSLILLFPFVTGRWVKAWKWAVACYLPLLLTLMGFFFKTAIVSQTFFGFSSLLCFFWVFFSNSPASCGLDKKTSLANIFFYIFAILVVVEFLGLLYWVLYPFANVNVIGSIFKPMAQLGMQLFFVPSVLAPFFVVFALFSWFLVPIKSCLRQVKTLVLRLGDKRLDLKEFLAVDFASSFRFFDEHRRILLLVVFSACLSFLYGVYAYLPILGGEQRPIGADIRSYVTWLDTMRNGGWTDAVHYAFFSVRDRPFSLMVFYAVSTTSGLPSWVVVQFAPLVLGPLTVLATFFFMHEAGLGRGVCALGSLFAASSFLSIVGIFSAFLSNWMAFIMVLFFSGLFIRNLRLNSWVLCFFSSTTLALTLFMHAYTWSITMAALGLFAFVLLLRRLRFHLKMTKLKMVLAIIVSNFVVDFARNLALGSGAIAVEAANVVKGGLSFDSIWFFWPTLNRVLQQYYLGLVIDSLMFILVFFGIVAVLVNVYSSDFSLYLVCWTVVLSVLMLFGNWVVQFRLLFNMPMHVLATLGIVLFDAWIQKGAKGRIGKVLRIVFILLVVLAIVNYALRSMITISALKFS